MKKYLIFFAVAAFTFAGAAQTTQTKKPPVKTAVKSPTPAKRTEAKTAAGKNTASTTNKPAAKATRSAKGTPNPKPKQSDSKAAKTTPQPRPTPVKKDDKGDFEKALAIDVPDDKIAALAAFLEDHPKSDLRIRALESLTAARAASGESRFEAGERERGLQLYKLAIKEAPLPYPDRLFNEVIVRIPPSLYFRGEQAAALELASIIEANSAGSVSRLLSLAGFYLLVENGEEAKRLAEEALKLDERSAAAFQVVGMAGRLNFDLEGSAAAFARALELDPDSPIARRSLAEMKRALGKPNEALKLFDELLAKDPDDLQSRNGRILSLFDLGKRSDAETELSKAILDDPLNVPLLAGAAYWYAAAGESKKALDMAGKAIAADPRYVWSHIALARALLLDGRFSDADQVLLNARKFGNFAALEYEIASARLAGGFYREAYEELKKSFSVENGLVSTKLGRRIQRSERSFIDLVAYERKASILEPNSADTAANADRLKALLELKTALDAVQIDPLRVAQSVEAFVNGSDKMRFHRQIYAANELLERKVVPEKALELSRAAIASVEDGLDVSLAAAPIMASELYASRSAAMSAGRYVLVPDVPKQTLSAIARGRIEEIAGWSLLQQGANDDAVIRLKRAVSILPEKSAWWRSSYWRLGQTLEAAGKDKDALEAYTKSYLAGEPDGLRYAAIKSVYRRTNDDLNGLEALIGADPTKLQIEPEKRTSDDKPVSDKQADPITVAEETDPKAAVGERRSEMATTGGDRSPVVKAKSDTATSSDEVPSIEKPKGSEPESKRSIFEPVVIEIKKKDEPGEKKADRNDGIQEESPNNRPRIVEGKEVRSDVGEPCTISVSQENISLIGGAGSIGILVGLDGANDISQLTASSISPKDIEVEADPEFDRAANRRSFVVRSLTPATGVYQIIFAAPCGRKEILVKVR